jgi:hypothetical protein
MITEKGEIGKDGVRAVERPLSGWCVMLQKDRLDYEPDTVWKVSVVSLGIAASSIHMGLGPLVGLAFPGKGRQELI